MSTRAQSAAAGTPEQVDFEGGSDGPTNLKGGENSRSANMEHPSRDHVRREGLIDVGNLTFPVD